MKRIRVEEINGIIYIDGVDILKLVSDFSKENDRLFLENKKQEDKIKKAIDYMEDKFEISEKIGEYYLTHNITKDPVSELYNILKNN